MGCRVCCCCSPRAGARIVGILDLLGGMLGVFFGGFLLVHVQAKERVDERPANATSHYEESHIEALWAMTLGCIFPSVLSVILGMSILILIARNNICIGRLSYFLTILLILVSGAAFVTLFILGYHWISILPLAVVAIIQCCFLCALQDFIKLELSIESV